VSTASTPFGTVLIVGSGANAGCSLYVLTSDQLHSLTFGLAAFACSNGPNAIGQPCDSVLWPALLTKGAPIAGPGVSRSLLGTVTRTDVLSGESMQQVTYAGLPLYRFFLDETPGQTDGANLFDPVTSPTGTWYLVEPGRGNPAPGRLHMRVETVSRSDVLSASMDNDFSVVLVALLIGFRSGAGVVAWLAVAGILIVFTLALTWIAVIPGLSAKSADGASAFAYPLIFLPFISSAFVPTDTMPGPVRAFAEHQPVTSIVNAIRDLYTQQPVGADIWIALAWCIGILIVAYIFAMVIYQRKIS
jgi:hypothetical protein